MGFIFPKIFTKLFGSKEYRLLILCLDNPGKTTIKYQMQLDEAKVTVPTFGFNVDRLDIDILKIDLDNAFKSLSGIIIYFSHKFFGNFFYNNSLIITKVSIKPIIFIILFKLYQH